MYAIIETGGKQLKVEAGDTIFVEKLDVEAGEKVVFDKVLAVGDKTMKLGAMGKNIFKSLGLELFETIKKYSLSLLKFH